MALSNGLDGFDLDSSTESRKKSVDECRRVEVDSERTENDSVAIVEHQNLRFFDRRIGRTDQLGLVQAAELEVVDDRSRLEGLAVSKRKDRTRLEFGF